MYSSNNVLKMKKEIRLLAIDDSPFTFHEKYVNIIGVVMRGGTYLECVLRDRISVDGNDATYVCKNMIGKTRHKKQLKAVLLDGVALGGFNIVDINKLYSETNIPIITITRDEPNFEKIKKALQKNFEDWDDRWSLLSKGELYKVKTKHNPIFVKCVGLSIDAAKEIIKLSTIRGVVPEPIRVAHLIASGLSLIHI